MSELFALVDLTNSDFVLEIPEFPIGFLGKDSAEKRFVRGKVREKIPFEFLPASKGHATAGVNESRTADMVAGDPSAPVATDRITHHG